MAKKDNELNQHQPLACQPTPTPEPLENNFRQHLPRSKTATWTATPSTPSQTVKPKQVRVNAQASTNQAVDKDSAKPSGDTHLSANSLTLATANDPTLATIAFKDVFDSVDVSRLFESILQDTRELHQQAPYQQLSQTALLPTETSTSSATSQQHLSYSLQQEQQQAQGSNSSTSATNQLLF